MDVIKASPVVSTGSWRAIDLLAESGQGPDVLDYAREIGLKDFARDLARALSERNDQADGFFSSESPEGSEPTDGSGDSENDYRNQPDGFYE